jgi:hypothetical protein
MAVALVVATGCADAAGSMDPEVAEVNFGDLSQADSPVLREIGDARSTWRRTDDRPAIEREARRFLEGTLGGDARIDGPPTTWVDDSGDVAVQYEITRDGQTEATSVTVLFAPQLD